MTLLNHTHVCRQDGCVNFDTPSPAACGCHKTNREMLESACAHMEAALVHFFARDADKPTNYRNSRQEAERFAKNELQNIGIRDLSDVVILRDAVRCAVDCFDADDTIGAYNKLSAILEGFE